MRKQGHAKARRSGSDGEQAERDTEIRCPGCGRLMAVARKNGLLEIKSGRLVIWTEQALLLCPKCGIEILADSEGVDKCPEIS